MRDLSRCTVLLVDDSEQNMDILVETLGEEMDVIVAMDGESALEAVADELPDLVLLDIEMPGIDGYEVCRRIKAEDASAHIPILFLTARSSQEDREKGLALGGVDFISKPFVSGDVRAKVRGILLGEPCAQDPAAS